jgi:uncharacterized protein
MTRAGLMDSFTSLLPTLLICTAALMAGGVVKGVVSLGLPLVALPVLLLAVDVQTAISLLMVPLLLSNLVQALEGPGTVLLLRRFWPLLLCLAVGTLIGTALLLALDRRLLMLTIGALAIVFATTSLLRPNLVVPLRAERWLAPPVGFVAGVIGGMSTLFGPIIATYIVGLRLPRDTFVKTIGLHYVVAAGFLLIGGASQGYAGPLVLLWSALGMIPVHVGMLIGQRIRHRIDPNRFQFVVLAAVWLTGANLIRMGLGF